jgi:hypothetical protein
MPEEKKYLVRQPSFYVSLVLIFGFVCLVMLFWPNIIPFKLFEFWHFDWDWSKFKDVPWFLLLAGPVLTVLVAVFTRKDRIENLRIRRQFGDGIETSILAGIFEEASFRWLLFYLAIVGFYLDNLFIGWLTSVGYINTIVSLPLFWLIVAVVVINILALIAMAILADDDLESCPVKALCLAAIAVTILLDVALVLVLLRWLYTAVAIPVVDWLTIGKLHFQLTSYSWWVGAAVISTNADFGKGHLSKGGCPGYVNSWAIGMLMFWVVFNFGLLPAMLIHALYDVFLHLIVYTDARIELATS